MHFPVTMKPDCWIFGQETFTDVLQFLEHFDNRPLLGDNAGECSRKEGGRKESKKGRMWERMEAPNFIFPSP